MCVKCCICFKIYQYAAWFFELFVMARKRGADESALAWIAGWGGATERMSGAESGLPGPTIDARGTLLYITIPALSSSLTLFLFLSFSVCSSATACTTRGGGGGYPSCLLACLLPSPSSLLPLTRSVDLVCYRFSREHGTWRASAKRYPRANKDPFLRSRNYHDGSSHRVSP